MRRSLRIALLVILFHVGYHNYSYAQFDFGNGPIAMGDTTCFTTTVWGVGFLEPPGWGWGFYLQSITLNITTDHPQTLSIWIISPSGDTLMLSEFNGAGGQNYTNTNFVYGASTNIDGQAAPFTGNWEAEGGPLSIFDWTNGDGTWTLCIADTASPGSGGGGGGGPWLPGYFGNAAGGAGATMAFGSSGPPPPPPCPYFIPDEWFDLCLGETVDLQNYYLTLYPMFNINIYDVNFNLVTSPVTVSGTYMVEAMDPWDGCFYYANAYVTIYDQVMLGSDIVINQCSGAPVNLTAYFALPVGSFASWSLNGTYVSAATAATATTPGTYQLIGYNPAGCNDTALVTLNITPGFSLGPDQIISTCIAGSIDLTTAYNTTGLITNWTFNGNPVANPSSVSANGNYMLIATDAGGCMDTAFVTLNQTGGIALGPNQSQNICIGTSFDLTTTYNTAGTTPVWYYNSNIVSNPSGVANPGVYTLIATAAGGCADTAEVTLGNLTTPALGANQVQSICSNATIDLSTLYTTTGYSTSWTLNGNSVSNPGAVNTSGTYLLVATMANGCSDTAQVTLNISGSPSLGPNVTVNNCNNTILDLTGLYATGGNITNWYLGGNLVSNPSSISNPGAYMLITTSPAGCSDTAIATVNSNPAPLLGANQSLSSCSNTPLNLNSLYNTTGLVTSWTLNGSPVSNPSSVNNSGTYILIATSAAGCLDTAQVALSVSAAPVLGANQSGSICSGSVQNLASVFSTGSNSTSWTFNGNPVSNPNTVTNAGSYILIATSAAGCSDTASYTLSVLPTPAVGANQSQSICSNIPLNLSALYNTTGYTASWTLNGAAVTNPNSVNIQGNYILVVTAAGGCSDTAEVSLTVSPAPALGANQSVNACTGIPVDLTSYYSLGSNNGAWTYMGNPVSNPTTVFNGGIYILVATSTAGCSDTAVVTLNNLATPTLGADLSQSICSNTPLDLTTLFNTSGYIPIWTLNGSLVTTPESVNAAGNYQLIATSGAGCADTAEVALNILVTPSLGTDQSVSVCNGDQTDITSLFNTSGYTIAWTLSGNPVPDPTLINSAGSYMLVATVGSCSDTAMAAVVVNPVPAVGSDQVIASCTGLVVDLTNLFATSGLSTNWTSGGNAVTNPSAVNTSGNYQLIAENNFGCSDTAMVALTMNQSPSLGPNQDVNICSGNTTNLESLYTLAGLTTSWSLNGNIVSDPTLVSAAGSYQLIVTDVNGCVDTAASLVTVNQAPVLGADQSHVLCPWMTLDILSLYDASSLTASVTFNNQSLANYASIHDSGMYALTVIDQNGCTDEALVSVSNMECLCEADFEYSKGCFQNPVSFELMADSAIEGAHWSFENSTIPNQDVINPLVYFQSADIIEVTLEAKLSCGTVTVKKEVQMEDCTERCHSYLPNAFTPNNDGLNDWFSLYSDCHPELYKLEIYNRFGQVVFKSEDPTISWNGKDDSSISPEGVYIYYVEYQLPYQDKQLLSGRLSLLR